MQEREFEETIDDYLKAFEARELSRCLGFYADDAMIRFEDALYRGKQAIEEWHKERFVADLRVLDIEEVRPEGNEVIVTLIVASKNLKVWNINRLNGTIAFLFHEGKIQEARFSLGMHNPELWEV